MLIRSFYVTFIRLKNERKFILKNYALLLLLFEEIIKWKIAKKINEGKNIDLKKFFAIKFFNNFFSKKKISQKFPNKFKNTDFNQLKLLKYVFSNNFQAFSPTEHTQHLHILINDSMKPWKALEKRKFLSLELFVISLKHNFHLWWVITVTIFPVISLSPITMMMTSIISGLSSQRLHLNIFFVVVCLYVKNLIFLLSFVTVERDEWVRSVTNWVILSYQTDFWGFKKFTKLRI